MAKSGSAAMWWGHCARSDSRSFVGTEGFIPPEGPGRPQADLYSLGIVLYVFASGKHHREFPEPPASLATRPDRAHLLELTAIIPSSNWIRIRLTGSYGDQTAAVWAASVLTRSSPSISPVISSKFDNAYEMAA